MPPPSIVNDDDLLIKIKAASINPIDIKLRSGLYPIKKFPAILGCDGAGTIEKTGSMVKNFKKGDAVFFFHGGFENIQGNYAEYKVISEKFVAHIPKSLSFEEAAAAPLALITAWESLFFHAKTCKKFHYFYFRLGSNFRSLLYVYFLDYLTNDIRPVADLHPACGPR